VEKFPDVVGDFYLSFCRGVDAIFLVEFFHAADAFDEEGDESGFGFIGDIGEEGLEGCRELGAHVVGHLHAGDEDFNFWIFGAGLGDDSEKVLFGFSWRDSAKAVVAAQGDDEDVGSFGHGPMNAPQATGGGVAANPGIGDGVGECGFGDLFLKEGRVGFFGAESVAYGDAIPQDDDAFLRIGCIRRFLCEYCTADA